MFKGSLLFTAAMIVIEQLPAQNIGIGSTAPTAKLQINHRASAASPSLRLLDSSTGTGSRIVFSKESQSNNFSILSTIDIFSANSSLDFRTTFNSGILLRGDGRVGINNIISPATTLHVGGGVKINDTLNVGGDINISGKLKLNNDAGTPGQVLVSNGNGTSPAWGEQALVNQSRFMFIPVYYSSSDGIPTNINHAGPNPQFDSMQLGSSVMYNTGTDFTISAKTLTVNTSGLYHFEGVYPVEIGSPGSSQTGAKASIVLSVSGVSTYKYKMNETEFSTVLEQGNSYVGLLKFSTDIYLSAGAVIAFELYFWSVDFFPNIARFGSHPWDFVNGGKFSGYKIAD